MEKKRILKITESTLIIITALVLIISFYNLFSFTSSISEKTFSLQLTQKPLSNDWSLKLDSNPKNTGILGIDLDIKISLLDVDGQLISTNSTKMHINSGGTKHLELTSTIPAEIIPDGNLENAKGILQLEMSVRTLGNLVGFTNILKVGGS